MTDEKTFVVEDQTSEAMEVATMAGHILLENGAEISRVEETMDRIASYYRVDSRNFFVLSNGIFSTGRRFASVEFIPFKGTQLDKVVAVNQLSREIERGKYSLSEAREQLTKIRAMKSKPAWEQILASALGSAFFCIIFGGSIMDSVVDFFSGILLYFFVLTLFAPRMSKIFGNICGAALVTLFCLFSYRLGIGDNLGNMIIGAVIPLIPGVSFTNGIRDIANEDYIAGMTRMLDALMVFFCIAMGVSLVFIIDSRITGSMIALSGMSVDTFTAKVPIQIVAAFMGTSAFAVLFGVPRRYYFISGICGTVGWIVFLLLTRLTNASVVEASCAATIAVALSARTCAVLYKCPITVFLICGIFPLVPGAGIFWTSYYVVANRLSMALGAGFTAIKVTIAIILGIILVSEIPFKIWRSLAKRKKQQKAM